MSNSKQKIISELKSKITQFKSKFKSHKTTDEEKTNDEKLILNFLYKNNTNISQKENSEISQKENNNNNSTLNKSIKTNKIERTNSSGFSSFNYQNKFISFDVDKMLNQTKKHSYSKPNINNIDLFDLNNSKDNNKNKTFINLDLNPKKVYSKTDRNKVLYNQFKTEYLSTYEQNYSEPNIGSYKKIKNENNFFNFNNSTKDNTLLFTRNKIQGERFSAKPEIRTDVSKYNLNFLAVNKNNKRKNFEQFFDKNHNIDNYSMNIKNILYNNKRKNSHNLSNNLNNKYLKSSYTTYNYNNYNCLNNFNKRNIRKNILNEFEDNKNNNINLNMDDIHKIKYMIQNLSNEEINNMPISVFKEMKELYEVIYKKFLKNNCI